MRLNDDLNLFKATVNNTANNLGIADVYVEKDYWIFLLIKEIFKNKERGYVFKGGTSLSKCYGLINRFSEDIDISYSMSFDSINSGEIKRKFKGITKAIKEIGLPIENADKLRWNRYFNQFICPYESSFDSKTIEKKVIIELAAQTPSFPSEQRIISSFIGEYFQRNNREDLIEQYGLEPFAIEVQSLSRTFIDKTFAICDYYLSKRCARHSRHLYDISKLMDVVDLDEKLSDLFNAVKEYRKKIRVCYSARDNHKLFGILNKIIVEQSFKNDYDNVTFQLLYDHYPYSRCEKSLQKLQKFLQENDI